MDSCIWYAMLKLNEYGQDYDVIERLDEAIAVAKFNNSTHLGWLYNYEKQSADMNQYVVNAFAPFILPLAYATNTSVKDYSSHISRIYTTVEDFRMANDLYKYKWTDPDVGNQLYSMWVLRNLMMGERYCPTIFNNTKIQETINALDPYTEMYRPMYMPRGASVAIWALGSGLTIPTLVRKACLQTYDQYYDNFDKKLAQKCDIVSTSWMIDLYMARIVTNLALNINSSISTITPQSIVHSTLNYLYSNLVCKNDSYIHGAGASVLYYPYFSAAVASRSHVNTAGWGTTSTWNSANNYFERASNFTYDGATCAFQWDKYHKWFSFQANQSVQWRVFFLGSNFFNLYDWKIIHSNGTVTQMTAQNGTVQVTQQFAIQCNSSLNDKGFYLFDANNGTLQQYTAGNQMWLWTELTQFTGYGRVLENLAPSSESEWDAVHTLLANGLDRLSRGASEPIANITVRQASQGWVIHSDANISNYQLTSEELRFTLTGNGATDQTIIHTGERGKPKKVTGASWWEFNATTKMLTMNSTGTEVIVDWATKASGTFNLFIHVTRDGKPTHAIINLDGDNYTAYALHRFRLPYGTYEVTCYCGDSCQTKQVGLFSHTHIGFNFDTPKRGLGPHWL